MSDYAFEHNGKAYTPNQTDVQDMAAHNLAVEQEELAAWAARPDRMLLYYHLPQGLPKTVTSWHGVVLGHITEWKVYRHNFGGRFVSLKVRGTNGAEYYGRASYDWGSCINLRKVK